MIFIFLILVNKSLENQINRPFFQSELFQQNGTCLENDQLCIANENNFIEELLGSYSIQQKLVLMNKQISYYSQKNLEIRKTESMGMGLFSNDNIEKDQIIVKFDKRKIIQSKKIQINLQFLRTLDIQLKKQIIKLSSIQIKQEYNIRILVNLLLHFSRFENSFLMDDLAGLPQNIYTPIFEFSDFEAKLLDQDKIVQNTIYDSVKHIKQEFQMIQDKLNQLLPREQFCLIFKRENISLGEYVLLNKIISNYTHKIGKYHYMIPYIHYMNEVSEITKNPKNIQFKQKNYQVQITSNYYISENEELYIFYGSYSIVHHALWHGYVLKKVNKPAFNDQQTDFFQNPKGWDMI